MSIQFIIEFIIALGALIFVHEFGHFIACKLLKIEVEEFGFGIPPRALTLFEHQGTKFTLNWLPLGGFVKPKGENDPTIPGSFASHKPWKRITVFLAGPTMNLLTAVALLIGIYSIMGVLPDRNRVQVASVIQDTPAAKAGLLAGDILVSVGGVEIESIDSVRPLINTYLGKPVIITVLRDGANQDITVTPDADPANNAPLGISMNFPMKPFTIGAAIPEGFVSLYDYCVQLFTMIGQLIRGQSNASGGGLVGIVGMYNMYSSLRESASTPDVPQIVNIMLFIASISLSLGLMNLLPIPALDGGRILFALPELIIHRRIPPKYEMVVISISFVLLIMLMIFINVKDIIQPIIISPATPIP